MSRGASGRGRPQPELSCFKGSEELAVRTGGHLGRRARVCRTGAPCRGRRPSCAGRGRAGPRPRGGRGAALHRGGPRRTRPFVVQPCAGLSPGDSNGRCFGSAARGGGARNPLDHRVRSPARGRRAVPSRRRRASSDAAAPAGAHLERRRGTMVTPLVSRSPRRARRRVAEHRLDPGLREDLLRRLPLVIELPSLRERRDDVPAIAEAMLAARGRPRRFTPAALTVLAALPWRRNTAELSGRSSG